MTVFKGNMLMFKRNMGLGIMYFVIFILITIMVTGVGKSQEEVITFDVISNKIGIVDEDESILSKGLISYLEKNNRITMYENDSELISEALYYEDVYSVLVIPEGFSKACETGQATVDITNAPNIQQTMYVKMDVNKYVYQVQTLKAAEFSDAEILSSVIENAMIESHVEIVDSEIERTETVPYNFFFGYAPYVYLSVLIFMLGNILIPKNQKDMAQRLKCSALSETRQSTETFLAFLVIGCIVFGAIILIASAFYYNTFYKDVLYGYYIFNSFIFMIVSLCISFMIATLAKGQEALSGLANVVSLGLCFVGGVFVPLQFMGEGIVKIAKFLPTYWYEINNSLLGNYEILKGVQLEQFRNGILAQLAMALGYITIAFLINSKKKA